MSQKYLRVFDLFSSFLFANLLFLAETEITFGLQASSCFLPVLCQEAFGQSNSEIQTDDLSGSQKTNEFHFEYLIRIWRL